MCKGTRGEVRKWQAAACMWSLFMGQVSWCFRVKVPLGSGRAHTDDSGQVSRGERHSAFGMYTRHSMHIWVVAKHRTTPAGQSVDEMHEDRQTETPSGGKKNHNTSNSCWFFLYRRIPCSLCIANTVYYYMLLRGFEVNVSICDYICTYFVSEDLKSKESIKRSAWVMCQVMDCNFIKFWAANTCWGKQSLV